MEFLSNNGLSVITVLIQGFLSFFSPCVLPLLPLYIGYLSGGAGDRSAEDGSGISRKTVLLNTVFFVVGISFSFFILGLGMRAIGRFFSGNQLLFSRVGGIIVILFGLYQLGIFGKSAALMTEKRLPVRFDRMAMSPLTALIMGFVFSFAWTPCVSPTLSSVLIMAASEKDSTAGFALIGVYTFGFALPFILAGIFTTSILNFFGRHKGFVKYTSKISGVLLIVMGVLMLTGSMNSITGFLSRMSGSSESNVAAEQAETAEIEEEDVEKDTTEAVEGATEEETTEASEEVTQDREGNDADQDEGATEEREEAEEEKEEGEEEEEETEDDLPPAPDITLTDQYGNTHTLSDYKGKVVFLNFWATWCPPCRKEMPYIQEIYEETMENDDTDLVILSVAAPNQGRETSEKGIRSFLDENGYTYPVLMDYDGEVSDAYYIRSYPTTFMIDTRGNIYGYVPGAMTKEIMEEIIRQTRGVSENRPR
ncbi:MAG: redoxin domain-containing protein [Lachnospiraceae bacterium]|nr:redoxin domain-containing protein [Lachnospiraceae bacterium]